jgi:glycosyltransferase involved in cell wall biosynthesis
MNDKITTLICTYRRPKSLRRAILSALNQTHGNLQVSVFDDASGDNSEQVVVDIMKNDDRVKYYCHASNIGQLPNYRFAFESIDTPYFSILSDDDLLVNDFYENAVNVLNNNPKIMFVILNSLLVDFDLNLTRRCTCNQKLTYYEDLNRYDDLHNGRIPYDWTAMVFRKEVAQIYLKSDNRYDITMDFRFLFHAAARYNFAYLSKVGALFTTHFGSASAAIPVISCVHLIVKSSGYVEIINDLEVDSYIRNRALFYLKKLSLKNEYKRALKLTVKRLIKNCCFDKNFHNDMIKNDIASFAADGYLKTSRVLNFFHNNRFVRSTIYALFFYYNNYLIRRNLAELNNLQNGEFKDILNTAKLIGK